METLGKQTGMMPAARALNTTALSVDDALMYAFGVLAPMPIIQIKGNTIFSYMILLVVGWNILCRFTGKVGLNWRRDYVLPFFIFAESVASVIVCLTSAIPDIFKQGEGLRIVWEFLYFLFFILFFENSYRGVLGYYVQGVLLSSKIQVIWAYLQLIFFRSTGKELNATVFYEYFHIDIPYAASTVWNDTISLPGLCWHPANMAPLMCIGYVLSDSILWKVLFIAMSFLTGSRTAVVGILICMLGELFIAVKNSGGYAVITKLRTKLICLIILLTLIFVFFQWQTIHESMIRIHDNYQTKMEALSLDPHFLYWLRIPSEFSILSPIQFLFGVGPECSGFVASAVLGMYPDIKWTMECDYLDKLWSYGILGFVLRYVWYIGEGIKAGKYNRHMAVLFLSFMIMGITYNILFNWVLIFAFSVFLLSKGSASNTNTSKTD